MNYDVLPGAIANGDMSTMQFSFVALSTGGTDFEIGLTTQSSIISAGVLQNDPDTSGHGAEVAISGVCKVRYGGTVTNGQLLVADTLGRAVAETTALNDWKVAQALQSGSSSEIKYVQLVSPYREGTA